MSCPTSKREENDHSKRGSHHHSRSDSGSYVELISQSGRHSEQVTNHGNEPLHNKLSKSKSDNIFKLFRRSSSSLKRKAKPIDDLKSDDEDLNESSTKGKPRSHKAFRSGTGPLILIKQLPVDPLQSDVKKVDPFQSLKNTSSYDHSTVVKKNINSNLENQPPISSTKESLIESKAKPEVSLNNTAKETRKKESTFAKYLPPKKDSSKIIPQLTPTGPVESSQLSGSTKANGIEKVEQQLHIKEQVPKLLQEKSHIEETKTNLLHGATKTNCLETKKKLCKQKNVLDQSSIVLPEHHGSNLGEEAQLKLLQRVQEEPLPVEHSLENKGTNLFKKLIGFDKQKKLSGSNLPACNVKPPIYKKPKEQHSPPSKVSEQKETKLESKSVKDINIIKIIPKELNRIEPVSEGSKKITQSIPKNKVQVEFIDPILNSKISASFRSDGGDKGKSIEQTQKPELPSSLSHSEQVNKNPNTLTKSPPSHKKLENRPIESGLGPKTSSLPSQNLKSSNTAGEETHLKTSLTPSNIPTSAPGGNKSPQLNSHAYPNNDIKLQLDLKHTDEDTHQNEYQIDNEQFHNQQSIREDQEKKILELHLKHLQEIQRLRSQSKDYRIIKNHSPVPGSSSATSGHLDKEHLQEDEANIYSVPQAKLLRSSTYDNPADFFLPKGEGGSGGAVKVFQTNSLPRKSSQKSSPTPQTKSFSTTEIPDKKFSFSNYLTKTRSNSVGEKDARPIPEVKEEVEVKPDLPKRVHFPDDTQITSTALPTPPEKTTVVNTNARSAHGRKSSRNDSSLGKVHKLSILKKSNSLDDAKTYPGDVISPPTEAPKERINSNHHQVIDLSHANIVPVKPPRSTRASKKDKPLEGTAMKQIMSSENHKEPAVSKHGSAPSHNKENSEPVSVHKSPKIDNFATCSESQTQKQRFAESQKRKFQQETNATHSETKSNLTHQTSLDSAMEKVDPKGSPVPSRAPQPPLRGQKPYLKGQNNHAVSAGCKPQGEVNSQDSVLVTACRMGEEEQIMKLLRDLSRSSSFDASFINKVDVSKRTALSHACSNGFVRVVEFLTSQSQIDLNLIDSEGNTPLHYAAQGGHVEVVSHLVNTCNRQVDLDVRNNLGFTPLMKAALQGRTKIAKILLFAGASPHLRDYGKGLCAVEWAKYTGRNVCSELIDSVQRSCSSHIRDRWTSDPDIKISDSGSNSSLSGYHDNKNSWLKHKIKKAFNKSDSKKEFNVASNLPTIAVCVSSPLLPSQTQAQDGGLPKVQVTEVSAPDCYIDPDEAQRLSGSQMSAENEEKSNDENVSIVTNKNHKDKPQVCSVSLENSSEVPKIGRNTVPTIEIQPN